MAKLFIKTTNERGKTASLSGNEYLDIDISVGNNRLASLTVRRHTVAGNEGWALFDEVDEVVGWVVDKKKGKTQQG